MFKLSSKHNVIDVIFYFGLALKFVNALIELVGGMLLGILNQENLNRIINLITVPEMSEDPHDIIMNYFLEVGHSLSIDTLHSISIYMAFHGITKMIVVWLLWQQKVWAYIPAAVIFGLFISYELYEYFNNHSIFVLIFALIDSAILVLTILEYRRLKAKTH